MKFYCARIYNVHTVNWDESEVWAVARWACLVVCKKMTLEIAFEDIQRQEFQTTGADTEHDLPSIRDLISLVTATL